MADYKTENYYDRAMWFEREQLQRVYGARRGGKDAAMRNASGAPTRATTLPDDSVERKKYPVASGFVDYFPDAIVEVSRVSWEGNEQHNPNQPLHWNRSKSTDEWNTLFRHFLQRGTRDADGMRHSAKIAWRAMAALQREIEEEQQKAAPPPANVLAFEKVA